jgi:hypothetical protein
LPGARCRRNVLSTSNMAAAVEDGGRGAVFADGKVIMTPN